MTHPEGSSARRAVLRGAVVGAGAAWAAPTILSSTPAAAGVPSGAPLIISLGVECLGEPGYYNFPIVVAPAAVGLRYDLVLSSGYSYCGVGFSTTGPSTSFTPGVMGSTPSTWVQLRLVDPSCGLIEASPQVPIPC